MVLSHLAPRRFTSQVLSTNSLPDGEKLSQVGKGG